MGSLVDAGLVGNIIVVDDLSVDFLIVVVVVPVELVEGELGGSSAVGKDGGPGCGFALC